MRRLLTLLIGLLAIAAISASAAARPLGPNGQIAFDRSDLETADGPHRPGEPKCLTETRQMKQSALLWSPPTSAEAH
jgi:hypothetical protein